VIDSSTGNQGVTLGMTPSGTAVAAWVNSSFAGVASSYNGSSWNAPQQFAAGPIETTYGAALSIAVNDSGRALVIWGTTSNELKSSWLAPGGTWTPEEIITTTSNVISDVDSALSNDGTGFTAWVTQSEGASQFADAYVLPLPPTNLQGFTCKQQFASGTVLNDIITFTPSVDPTVVAYNIRRNGVLIATIPANGPFTFVDPNRCQPDIFAVTSVDFNGVESSPVTLVL
jgi:hypothetical protein